MCAHIRTREDEYMLNQHNGMEASMVTCPGFGDYVTLLGASRKKGIMTKSRKYLKKHDIDMRIIDIMR